MSNNNIFVPTTLRLILSGECPPYNPCRVRTPISFDLRRGVPMLPENVSIDSIHIKTPWLELNAAGSFTIGTLAVLFVVWLVASLLSRR